MHMDWEMLEGAFDFGGDGTYQHYLDRETGRVIFAFDEDEDEVAAREEDPERYVLIDPPGSRDQWRWMSDFAESVQDRHLADLLEVAIDGPGAFRRFKDVLERYPAERERWFQYRNERMRQAILDWLEAKDIHPDNPPPWTTET